MTEPIDSQRPDTNKPDETFTWTGDAGSDGGADGPRAAGGTGASDTGASGASGGSSPAATATAILESVREAVDDLADRASPTVREFSARAAELAADAADRAAPLVKRAGDATADASGKLASNARNWAAELRASLASSDTDRPASPGSTPGDGSGTASSEETGPA
jgi:hypothetical protein